MSDSRTRLSTRRGGRGWLRLKPSVIRSHVDPIPPTSTASQSQTPSQHHTQQNHTATNVNVNVWQRRTRARTSASASASTSATKRGTTSSTPSSISSASTSVWSLRPTAIARPYPRILHRQPVCAPTLTTTTTAAADNRRDDDDDKKQDPPPPQEVEPENKSDTVVAVTGNANNAKSSNTKTKPKPKQKNKKTNIANNRPKPMNEVNLCDFISVSDLSSKKKKGGAKKKKATFTEKLARQEQSFRVKAELSKHPYIVRQQQLRQQRLEQKQHNNKKSELTTVTAIADKQSKTQTIALAKSEKKKKKSHSTSTKKHIKKSRIHKGVIETVEFLVNAVCDPSYVNGNGKQSKSRKIRHRKKQMEKLRSSQPDLIGQRQTFQALHSGSQSSIMRYNEVRSYCNHLTSDELHDRIGFLLKNLAEKQQLKFDKEKEKEKQDKAKSSSLLASVTEEPSKVEKFFLCGMRECLKMVRNQEQQVIGVIMSSQMELLPESSGLDKMVDEIRSLCQQRRIPIIYALRRKQLNFILKLKPWQGNVSCVTLLNVHMFGDTWQRIIEITRMLNEQYLMWQNDFIPVYRSIALTPGFVPAYNQEVKEEEKENEELRVKKMSGTAAVDEKNETHGAEDKPSSKLSAKAVAFDPNEFWVPPIAQTNMSMNQLVQDQQTMEAMYNMYGLGYAQLSFAPNT